MDSQAIAKKMAETDTPTMSNRTNIKQEETTPNEELLKSESNDGAKANNAETGSGASLVAETKEEYKRPIGKINAQNCFLQQGIIRNFNRRPSLRPGNI